MLRLLTICLIAFGLLASAGNDARASDDIAEIPVLSPRLSAVAKWRVIQRQMNEDASRLAACRADTEACNIEDRRFEAIVGAARMRDGLARIGEINRTVNLMIRPMSDLRRFGTRDQWSSPLETLRDGVGDCEDYAILKYLALREAGFAEDDFQFLIVRDPVLHADHAMVAVRHDSRWIVLDNRTLMLADLQSALQFKRYRVMVQFGRDVDAPGYAAIAVAALDIM